VKRVVWDCETINSPPSVGWKNFKDQGVEMCCIYDYELDEYKVYNKDNYEEFMENYFYNWRVVLIGYNSEAFDFNLVKECWGDNRPGTYATNLDLYKEICDGMNTKFAKGKLDEVANLTLNERKASIDFNNSSFVKKLNYCLRDVWLTKRLFEYARRHNGLFTPDGWVTFMKSGGMALT
jgi:hypothetical protein